MAKKTSKKTAEETTTAVKTPTVATKTTTPAVTAAPVMTTPVVSAAKPVAPVATAPVKTEVVAAKTNGTTTAAIATATNGNGHTNGNGYKPVAVTLQKTGAEKAVKATIRYQGPLSTKSEKLLAVIGMEWFGGARWQGSKDVEMKKSRDGAFEAEVDLTDTDGKALMALQLAFTTPTRTNWDSGGVPYGYYQVSALNGHVETVPHLN